MSSKNEIKKKILKIGKEGLKCGKKWKKEVGDIPFNAILGAIFGGRFGDKMGHRCFEKLRIIAKNTQKIPEFLRSIDNAGLHELFSKEIKTGWKPELVVNAIKALLELDKKYNLRSTSLEHIDKPEKFYEELRKIPILRGDEIGPWIALELVRNYNLKLPKNIELPKSTKDCLKVLGLTPSDFSLKEYPCVDVAFEKRDRKGDKIRKYEPHKLIEFFDKYKDP